MAQNDLGAFNMSGMDEYLCEILQPINENSTVLPTLFGDRIFKAAAKRCQTVLVAHEFDEDDEFAEYFTIFTKRMNVCRQSEELMYGALFSTFKLLTNRSKHKILGGGDKAYRCAVVGFFLSNCYSCLNGSACASMFGLQPPSLEMYIPVESDFSEKNVSAGMLRDALPIPGLF
jgi:hypothetical protein